MKIRSAFISNSSSTSFVIALKEDKCPTCGYSNSLLVNFLSIESRYSSDFHSYISQDYEELLEELSRYLVELEEYRHDILSHTLDEVVGDGWNTTWRERLVAIEKDIKETIELQKKIKDYHNNQYEVYEVNISNHNPDLLDLIRSNESIIILDEQLC